ncbi:MAG: DotD/TraH family lipoprotein [Alphaproteobacteria bacterium]|nr:DotD/TraH family lipoprotein [Alphaproteobacteria bacterium]
MVRFLHLNFLAVGVCLLSACAGSTVHSAGEPQIVAAPDKVSAMLAEAADKASDALETLAAVENARTPAANVGPVGNAPPELRRAITVNWIGPVEPITKTLADRAGYEFLTIGTQPPVAAVVSVDVENRPVIDVLRDIGLQLGVRGDIKVDSAQRVVEIHYPPSTGPGQ